VLPRPGDLIPGSVLDGVQHARLAEIAKVLRDPQTAGGAIVLGLMDAREWPWGWTCPLSPIIGAHAPEFGLSPAQVTQFEQLEQAARRPIFEQEWETQKRGRELVDSRATPDSPEVTQLRQSFLN